jgi:hypothetical protein
MIKEEEAINRYILLISNFYEKVTSNHDNKDMLKKAIQAWKQQANTLFSTKKNEDDETKTLRTAYNTNGQKRSSSPSKPAFLKQFERLLVGYSTFMFKDENDFLRVFSYSYLAVFMSSADNQQIEALKEDITKFSELLEGTTLSQNIAVRKKILIIAYLANMKAKSESDHFRSKLEKISYEDKTILTEIVKICVLSKRPAFITQWC